MHRVPRTPLSCSPASRPRLWDKAYWDHRTKVLTARPLVDTQAPTTFCHLRLKVKRLKLEEERLHAIDRENRLLLERVARILRTKGSLAGDMTRSWGACPAYMAPTSH
ncbi:uncharacterized protein CFAP97D2 [Ochotona princeps]|uniref:uncharacterized protein CFAP97D2 n=1 Tax=Ochotona princeps TaxID=9978 RepID=UPI0027145043|nr:uncharacterized protein CFAP97D2 [Ochotona princeps]